MQDVMNFIFSKRNYKYYITLIGIFTNLIFCLFSLLPPYLLKKPNFYISEINSSNNISEINNNKSVEFQDEYCDSSKYIIRKDPINSLHNWAYEYDLYCDKKKEFYSAGIVISLFTGATLGNIIFETIPDKHGREKIYKAISVIELFLQINLILDFGIIHLIIIMFFIGINLYIFPLSLVVIEELIVDDLGVIYGLINAIYPLGGVLVALWFMKINNLKQLFCILFTLLMIFNYFLLKYFYESPRWLHSQGRKRECLEVLTKVARFNNIEVEWDLYQKNNPEIIELIGSKKQINNNIKNNNGNFGFLTILKIKSQRYKFINTLIVVILSGSCFFGIVLYLDQMKGNFFLNAILSFTGELISELSCGKLMDIYGRKTITILLMLVGDGFFILYEIFPEKYSGITLFFSMMGFSGNFICLSVLINESFATEIRGTVLSDCFIMMRIAPIIIKILGLFLSKRIIDIIFIFSGIGNAYLTHKYFSETLGQKPKDFIYEDEDENTTINLKLNFQEKYK